jgi:flagellar motor switch/type III secretory pathway protein FliN
VLHPHPADEPRGRRPGAAHEPRRRRPPPAHEPRAFLPESALADGVLLHLLRDMFEQWTAKWLPAAAARPLGLFAAEAAPSRRAQAAQWLLLEPELALGFEGEALATLASLMLGEPIDKRALTNADRSVLDRLGGAAIDDLCRRAAETFRLPRLAQWQRGRPLPAGLCEGAVSYAFGTDPEAPLIGLVAAADLAVALRKGCVRTAPRRVAPRPMDEALSRQPVSLSARLGRCELALQDFAGLCAGDVVVLDRNQIEPLDLVVDCSVDIGTCVIAAEGDACSLKILEISGMATDT